MALSQLSQITHAQTRTQTNGARAAIRPPESASILQTGIYWRQFTGTHCIALFQKQNRSANTVNISRYTFPENKPTYSLSQFTRNTGILLGLGMVWGFSFQILPHNR